MELDPNGGSVIAIVDDDEVLTALIARWLRSVGHTPVFALNGAAALQLLTTSEPDLLLVDLDLGDMTGLELLDRVRAQRSLCPFVMITGSTQVTDVVEAMRLGALDYIVKPVSRSRVLDAVRDALQRSRARRWSHQGVTAASISKHGLVGDSPPLRKVHAHINRLAQCDVTVLITGETGTGKEVVARAIHSASSRSAGPFIAVNCGAIPEALQESEFFGHERGAFTGAISRHIGAFELANGGTLFLDEVGDLTPSLQVMLLRVLQERRFRRVGGTQEVSTDVRIIAATHRDLFELVHAGQFREDLYYRVAVYELGLPPLRVRGDDVLLIANDHLGRAAARSKSAPVRLSPAACDALVQYHWPGNVRELLNTIEHALVACDTVVEPEHLPARVVRRAGAAAQPAAPPAQPVSGDREREVIMAAIAAAGGNVSEAMRTLGIPRTTMYRKLRKLGIRTEKAGG